MTVGLDLTKRSVQDYLKQNSLPWAEAKAFNGSAVIGEWVDFNQNTEYTLIINGNMVQRGSINEMSWNPGELIEKLANWAPIRAGDILFTGTPSGVGPLKAGDQLTAILYVDNEQIIAHSAECV